VEAEMKKTLIIGASSNPERYAYKAAEKLVAYGHEIEMVGLRPDTVMGKVIATEKKVYEGIHTVTMYVSPKNQPEYYEYILSLNPQRVLFNPGTENPEFEQILSEKGILSEEACTLVLLGIGQY
jgi:uncharacterized protein